MVSTFFLSYTNKGGLSTISKIKYLNSKSSPFEMLLNGNNIPHTVKLAQGIALSLS